MKAKGFGSTRQRTRRAEAARLAPQDIEWAVAGDRLWLLQSRPITALPIAPDIDTPKGSWQKDAAHFAEPLSPFAVSALLPSTVGLYELAVACEELLGWDLQKTTGLLQGLSNTSTASTDALAALARRAGQRRATRDLLEARTPDIPASARPPSVLTSIRSLVR